MRNDANALGQSSQLQSIHPQGNTAATRNSMRRGRGMPHDSADLIDREAATAWAFGCRHHIMRAGKRPKGVRREAL
jgi:hypothetical protein